MIPGDIYLVNGHTALIVTEPNCSSDVTTVQFSRDIYSKTKKVLGGGTFDYNLINQVKDDPKKRNYILRPTKGKELYESCTLHQLLTKIDEKYYNQYPNEPTEEVTGNCEVFIENF